MARDHVRRYSCTVPVPGAREVVDPSNIPYLDRTPQRIICYECGKRFRTAAVLAEHAQRHRKTEAKAAKAKRAKNPKRKRRSRKA